MTEPAWVKFRSWSGPRLRGSCRYVLPENPSGFDVIVAGTAEPEGGTFDNINMYDGTAVTYGLLQWTFTSGRLHKLLIATAKAMTEAEGPTSYWFSFGEGLKELTGLRVNLQDGNLYLGDKKITDFFSLRDVCTPPGGRCPRTGPEWEKASGIAKLFKRLGENPVAQKTQLEFFKDELKHEIMLKRPKLNDATIASFLYPNGWTGDQVEIGHPGPEMDAARNIMAARALFWGMWQNAPRQAEAYLFKTSGVSLSTENGLARLVKLFAYSTFARWGVEKAAANRDANRNPDPYKSRYEKVAKAINKAMCAKIIPEYWK